MTSRSINYEITARSQIDQVMNQIAGAVQNMGNVSAAQIPKLAKELANAQTATTRAATAIEQYRQNLLKTDTAQQRLTAGQNATAASIERLRRESLQTATAEQNLAAAALRTQAAYSSAAVAAGRYSDQIARVHREAASGGGSGPSSAGEGGGGAAALIGGLAGGVVALAVNGIKAVGEAALDTGGKATTLAGNLETTRGAFISMTGSAVNADKTLKVIREYADDTAFQFPQLETAVVNFKSAGLGIRESVSAVKDLGDEIAGRGKDAAVLDRLALAQQQVISKGKLMGEEAMQMQESAGLPVWKILGDYLNIDSAAAQELSSQGKITAEVWSNALHADVVKNWAGAAERASETWAGLNSTLVDTGDSILATLGGPAIRELEPVLASAIRVLKDPGVQETIKGWADAIGLFINQVRQGAALFAQLFGLQLPAIQQQKDDLGGVAERWNTISVAVGDVTTQTQALKDSEEGIRTRAEATGRAYDAKLQRLHDQETSLQRAFDTEQSIIALHRLDADIDRDKKLGVNIFTDTGRRALLDAEKEGEQRNDLIRRQGFDAQKQGIQDAITATERQKQAAAQQAQDQIRAIETNIKGIEREAKAYDEYNRAKIAAIQKYRDELEKADTGAGGISIGTQIGDIGSAAGANTGLLDQFNLKIRELIGESGIGALVTTSNNLSSAWRELGGIAGGLMGDIGKLGEALGVDKGIAAAFKGAEGASSSLFNYLIETMPKVETAVGAGFARVAGNVSLAIKGFTAGIAGIRAMGPGATEADRKAFADSAMAFQNQLTGGTSAPATGAGAGAGVRGGAQPNTPPTQTRDRIEQVDSTRSYRNTPQSIPIKVTVSVKNGNIVAAVEDTLQNSLHVPRILDRVLGDYWWAGGPAQ